MKRVGWTLLELVVVVAIIGILIALLIPAVQTSRESMRRIECTNKMRQIGIAIQNYDGTHGVLPPANTMGFGFLVSILPQLEKTYLYNQVRFEQPVIDDPALNALYRVKLADFLCPSDSVHVARFHSSGARGATNYVGNAGYNLLDNGFNGVFVYPTLPPKRYLQLSEITDGTSQTVAISECLVASGEPDLLRGNWQTGQMFSQGQFDQFCTACRSHQFAVSPTGDPLFLGFRGWAWYDSGCDQTLYTHCLSPNQLSCTNGGSVLTGIFTAASQHPNGVNAMHADGHIEFVAESIDIGVWRALGGRDDGLVQVR